MPHRTETVVHRRKGSRSVKRAVSLPEELDAGLRRIAASEGASYSSVIREAAELLLGSKEASEVREAYARYYADEKNRQRDLELERDLSTASGEDWP